MTDQARAVAAAQAHRDRNGAAILAEFAELCAIPNVSSDLAGVGRNAARLCDLFAGRGVELRLGTIADVAPLVHGRIDVSGAIRTIGIYFHYDGQPVGGDAWRHPPFEPTLYTGRAEDGGIPRPLPTAREVIDGDWRLYARGSADDRAPAAALLGALDALANGGLEPTSNIVFAFEGEEEIGSPHLPDHLAAHADELRADLWLICDGPVHQTRRPQVVFGVRGYAGLELTVYGADRELHSGHYGNWAPNPALRLAHLLASMKDDAGRVTIAGFGATTRPISDSDRAALAELPDDDPRLLAELGLAAPEMAGTSLAERLMLPSFNVRGLRAADVGGGSRNVVPAAAHASIDVRLAPGDDAATLLDRVEDHLRGHGAHVVHAEPDRDTRLAHPLVVKVEREEGYPGVRASSDLPLAKSVVDAAHVAAGEPPIVLPTFGGSVPLHGFVEQLGAPVVIVPFANHDDDQHAPNENLRIANLWYGIDLMTALLTMP